MEKLDDITGFQVEGLDTLNKQCRMYFQQNVSERRTKLKAYFPENQYLPLDYSFHVPKDKQEKLMGALDNKLLGSLAIKDNKDSKDCKDKADVSAQTMNTQVFVEKNDVGFVLTTAFDNFKKGEGQNGGNPAVKKKKARKKKR